jgi:hypothetical protein
MKLIARWQRGLAMASSVDYRKRVRSAKRGRKEHALTENISEYKRLHERLEREHHDEYARVREGALVGVFADFDKAAGEALKRFGKGPYLIRRIGADPTADAAIHLRFYPSVNRYRLGTDNH